MAKLEVETLGTLPARAVVSSLDLSNFRNYGRCAIDGRAATLVLFGHNGSGKTNLLEAISMLAPGTGMRNARLDQLARIGHSSWRIDAKLNLPDGSIDVSTWRDPAKERRQIAVNGKLTSLSTALADVAAILWLTPAMDRLFVESGSSRRRFLDRLVLAVNANHGTQVREFDRAMRERARVLQSPASSDRAWLAVLERRMAEAAVAVAAARLDLVKHLQTVVDKKLDPFDRPKIEVRGDVERLLEQCPALDAEERVIAQLSANRAIDRETGRTHVGTHRSDLVVFDYETMEPAASCSTGRQKALLIAIILAEARLRLQLRGTLPVLLLDELTAHLDSAKRGALMDSLSVIGAQTWLTGTDAELFGDRLGACQFLHVVEGRIELQ